MRKAFTLVELLIVVAILAILLTFVVVAIRGLRSSSTRTMSVNALRQVVRGYESYATDHRQALLPGYLEGDELTALGGTPTYPDGTLVTAEALGSYAWRLLPYLDDAHATLLADYSTTARSRVGTGWDAIALAPSYGLNSHFLGGHSGSSVVPPWDAPPSDPETPRAAERLSDVRRPVEVIVFASVQRDWGDTPPDFTSGEPPGSYELRPPYLDFDTSTWQGEDPQWDPTGWHDPRIAGSVTGGWPIDRLNTTARNRFASDLVPLAHLDGSTGIEVPATMASAMWKWSPFVLGRGRVAYEGTTNPGP